MTTLAVFGGSFDPPHIAHVLVACWARLAAPVDRVLIVPTFQHAFGKQSVPFAHRFRMAELAMAPLRDVEVSDIERELGGESRTFHTLEALSKRYPGASFRLVIGADILNETHKWFRWEEVAAMAPPLVVGRGGFPTPDESPLVMPELSSTDVRQRLGRGENLRGEVPPAVLAYIAKHELYGAHA